MTPDNFPQASQVTNRMTWHRNGGSDRFREPLAREIVAWIERNGGEARYEDWSKEQGFTSATDACCIVIRGATGDVIVKPGDTVVMRDKGFQVSYAPVAQGTELSSPIAQAAGSNPAGGTRHFEYVEDPDDTQVKWGSCADPRGVLTVGSIYEVERVDIHSWHTKIFVKGIDSGRGFNSVSFLEVEDPA